MKTATRTNSPIPWDVPSAASGVTSRGDAADYEKWSKADWERHYGLAPGAMQGRGDGETHSAFRTDATQHGATDLRTLTDAQLRERVLEAGRKRADAWQGRMDALKHDVTTDSALLPDPPQAPERHKPEDAPQAPVAVSPHSLEAERKSERDRKGAFNAWLAKNNNHRSN